MTTFTGRDIHRTYRNLADKYDLFSKLLFMIGFREKAYRKRTVDQLRLAPGDTVVELGCGTGMNFQFFQHHIGPAGRIVGVDFSEAMLAEARKKIDANGWRNIDLVHGDAAEYAFPAPVDGVLSTFSLVFMPDYERIIRQASRGLTPGKRFAVLD
jgi:ubiquinone/menaquinone biosynthesis C-methylase UbiE